MKNLSLPVLVLLLPVFSSVALPQRNMSPPPAPLDPDRRIVVHDQPTLTRRVDLLQVQKEADTLALTAQTIPADIASIRKGIMPKDVLEKLKQIEKLSKHLRAELNP